jgi:hypothetical protein
MTQNRNWRIAQPRRPVAGVDPAVARLSDMMVAVLSELTVIRERLDTVERLVEQHGLFKQSDVETFEPSVEAESARTAIRKRQIQKVMRPLLEDIERDLRQSKPAKPRAEPPVAAPSLLEES